MLSNNIQTIFRTIILIALVYENVVLMVLSLFDFYICPSVISISGMLNLIKPKNSINIRIIFLNIGLISLSIVSKM